MGGTPPARRAPEESYTVGVRTTLSIRARRAPGAGGGPHRPPER
ncbi:hypothetical protein ACFOW4_27395 [Micromonospora sp. GCM10011542]